MAEQDYSITITEGGPYIVRGGVPMTTRHPVESARGRTAGLGSGGRKGRII